MIVNPILPGFNPDPSICRVGRGLLHRHLDIRVVSGRADPPFARPGELEAGLPPAYRAQASSTCAATRIRAASGRRACRMRDGLFWLVYTDVKRIDGNFKDTHNYIVTAPSIEGPWSDPVYVNSSGFDPSLFHDDDGRKWFLNMVWNHRGPGVGGQSETSLLRRHLAAGIGCGSGTADRRTGHNVFAGSDHGLVEGPAPLQAQRLVLPDRRRRRHRL